MTIDEFKNQVCIYDLEIIHVEVNRDSGLEVDIKLTPKQINRLETLKDYQWEQYDFRAKMLIVEAMGTPLGMVRGSSKYYGGVLLLTGSCEYMWGMIIQLFQGWEKEV